MRLRPLMLSTDIVQLSCIFQLRLSQKMGKRLFKAIMTKTQSNIPSAIKP